MKISIGNDHAGTKLKEAVKFYLEKNGHEVKNHGTDLNQSVDYPDFIHPVANDIKKGKADLGIVICGSGNGAAMTANIYHSYSIFWAYKSGWNTHNISIIMTSG